MKKVKYMYTLVTANNDHIELLKKYKLSNILNFAKNISEVEKNQIINYVNTEVQKHVKDYKIIKVDSSIVGSFLVVKYEDGILLDEIYLEKEYRNKKIGSSIINNLINEHNIIYLWVYKENLKAIKLYKRYNFIIIKETETRYFMKYQKNV